MKMIKKVVFISSGILLFSCASQKDLGLMQGKVETLEKEVATLRAENKALTQAIVRLDERTSGIVKALSAPQGNPENQVYSKVDVYPKYPGGDTTLFLDFQNEFKFPKEVEFKGEIVTQFVVEIDGSLSNFSFSKNTPKEFAVEIQRTLLAMKKWNPGVLNGKKVRCIYNIPINV